MFVDEAAESISSEDADVLSEAEAGSGRSTAARFSNWCGRCRSAGAGVWGLATLLDRWCSERESGADRTSCRQPGPDHGASCERSQRGDRGVGLAAMRGADPFAELR
jgi:hypothetical protein